jgi:hypothetical protein
MESCTWVPLHFSYQSEPQTLDFHFSPIRAPDANLDRAYLCLCG